MTDIEKLQRSLHLIRKAAGWTAEELGNKIGVTKQTISNLETLKSRMTKTQYLAIQLVISQKIASSPDNLTLVKIMEFVMDADDADDETINYVAIPDAMAAAESENEEKKYTKSDIHNPTLGIAVGSTVGGVAGAMAMLGLGPVSAVSAAVLGATIYPWLTKALTDDDKKK